MRALCLLVVAACGATVFPEESTDPTGGTTSTGASGPSAGGGGDGGSGGEPADSPVPGCEALVWAGDPIELNGTYRPQLPKLASLDGASAGLVYVDRVGNGGPPVDQLLSVELSDVFTTWPPLLSSPVLHHEEQSFTNSVGIFSSRRDGTFAVSINGKPLVARFGVPDAMALDEVGNIELQPASGAGAFLVGPGGVRYTDLQGSSQLLANLEVPECSTASVSGATDQGIFLSVGAFHLCAEEPQPEQLYFVGAGGLEPRGSVSVSFIPEQQTVIATPEALWLALANFEERTVVYTLDASGQEVLQSIELESTTAGGLPSFAPWRKGVVSARRDETGGLIIRATDGVHLTTSRSDPQDVTGQTIALIAGPDGRSLLVAYISAGMDAIPKVKVARADCVAAD